MADSFRLKPSKASKGKKTLITFLLIALVIVLAGMFFMQAGEKNTNYFWDKDLGSIKVSSGGLFSNIPFVQQTATFQDTEVQVGDVTSLRETIQCAPGTENQAIESIGIVLTKPDGFDITIWSRQYTEGILCNDFPSFIVAFTPSQVGTYSVRSAYTTATSFNAGFQGTNTLTVVEEQQNTQCPNTETSAWTHDSDISGGIYEKRTITTYSSPPTCSASDSTEYRTVCDDGYQLTGSNGDGGPASGKLSCELIPATDENCVQDGCSGDLICNQNTNQCEDPECNEDDVATCSDGTTTYIRRQCTNGLFGEEQTADCPDDEDDDDTQNDTNSTDTDTDDDDDTNQDSNDDETDDTSDDEGLTKYRTLITVTVFGVIAIVLVVIVWLVIRGIRKKKK